MKKQIVKPAKGISRITFFVGILFSIFGIMFILTAIMSPVSLLLVPFAILWTSIAVFNTVRAYKNGFTEKGAPFYEINTVEENSGLDFDEKLRSLNELKSDGLITDTEFNKKRNEIMGKEW